MISCKEISKEQGRARSFRNREPQGRVQKLELLLRGIRMAKKSLIVKAQRKPKFSTRTIRRCFKCGRPRGFMRDFNLCRICFREEALEGNIPGIKKSSW